MSETESTRSVIVTQESGIDSLRLRDIALAAIAMIAAPAAQDRTEEAALLFEALERALARSKPLSEVLDEAIGAPAPEDAALSLLRSKLRLSHVESLAVALAAAAEEDAITGRILSHVQAPVGGSRPTLGLIARTIAKTFDSGTNAVAALLDGPAFGAGALAIVDDRLPLCEQAVTVPPALSVALAGGDGRWPGATIGIDDDRRVPLAPSTLQSARRHAAALARSERRTLLIRAASPAEGRSVAAVIAQAIDRRPVFMESTETTRLGPWITLRRLLPIFCLELNPGEVRRLPAIIGYDGAVLVVTGPDGAIDPAAGAAATWSIPVPSRDERRILWWAALGDEVLARDLGDQFRHGAGRIAQLARLAHHEAALAGRQIANEIDIFEASWSAEGAGLDGLAQAIRAPVADGALVVSPAVRRELESVVLRCRLRDDLVAGLGASATTRYCPGLRVLMVGPSGTGKTLAAGWLATRLGFPLYRVDLASVTSKYIGETEKNLSQLLARAEHAEVILLFDEADSLFGKRTDVNDANDRFANGQTNYLLQRIESYGGIVLLTSNGQTRFDPAFARRLDFTIEFPLPGPIERRSLWQSHLGPHARLDPAELNQLAALLDVSGGHIRNAVLAAAVQARHRDRAITYEDVVEGAAMELAKLGRQLPVELRVGR
jgi:hypothetical protein